MVFFNAKTADGSWCTATTPPTAREDQGGGEGVVRHERTGDDHGPDGEMIPFVSAALLFCCC